MTTEAYIFEAIRTPRGRGKKTGLLHSVKPIDLVTGLIGELRNRFPDLDEDRLSDVILGIVGPVGDQGADLARVAVTAAGLPDTVGGVQINRFCASGLEAVNMAAQKVRSGFEDLIIAGGVESMSRVPMGSDEAMLDGLNENLRKRLYLVPQGISADLIATREGFTRDDVDKFALASQQKAARAIEAKAF
ncbi:MAG: acetyl-CoA C-acyltransferase, partial [Aldersonia sp.]|nr:acetyl-CoA C-acyltransferase [Aldersonia sp.]